VCAYMRVGMLLFLGIAWMCVSVPCLRATRAFVLKRAFVTFVGYTCVSVCV
jgi:hypothetical protein